MHKRYGEPSSEYKDSVADPIGLPTLETKVVAARRAVLDSKVWRAVANEDKNDHNSGQHPKPGAQGPEIPPAPSMETKSFFEWVPANTPFLDLTDDHAVGPKFRAQAGDDSGLARCWEQS